MALQADLPEFAVAAMKKLIESDECLDRDELFIFCVANKKLVACWRSSWRAICSISRMSSAVASNSEAKGHQRKIEKELKRVCEDVLKLLEEYLIPKADVCELQVFFFKMKGDYYRYLAEICVGSARKKMAGNSELSYTHAYEIARVKLKAFNPVRLALALNFSTFYHGVGNASEIGYDLAKDAYDEAIDGLDDVGMRLIMHRQSCFIQDDESVHRRKADYN